MSTASLRQPSVSLNKSLIEQFNKRFVEGRDAGAFYELLSPAFINHAAPAGMQGLEDTLHFFERVLWPALPDLRVEILEQIGEGDRVVSHKILHATLQKEFMGVAASGHKVRIRVIDIFRIEDGRLMEHWGMADLADLQRQVGQKD